ncbi:MAG: hypothetical protein LBD42_00445 [Desulfovibrio sp.]|jgi:hypothetical protein|nr:hypothetical protein [Desulfovibrio sp.]
MHLYLSTPKDASYLVSRKNSWLIFDTARCRFIFPEWTALHCHGLITKKEFQAQAEQDFEEVLRIKQGFESVFEAYLRAFAADRGIPYDFLIRPIPKAHHE